MRGDLAVRAVELAHTARRGWLYACDKTQRAAVVTRRAVRNSLRGALAPAETALLSPAGRERIHATTTFALIFLFAVSSVDFLIAGGAEFGAPARAAPAQSQTYAARTPATPGPVRAEPAAPTEIAATLAEAAERNVTPTSQSLFVPLSETPASAPAELVSISAIEGDTSPPVAAPLVGEATAQPSAEPPRPRKAEPNSHPKA